MASLGCHVEGVALPHPDLQDAATCLHGAKCRFLAKMPTQNEELMAEFKIFVAQWLKDNLVPLAPDTDVSFETWLSEINHPQWRKDELKKCWEEHGKELDLESDTGCSAFAKDETYPEYKPTRWINSRSDAFKCFAGPWIRAIEKVVYKLKWFIKNVPVKDRPKKILEDLYRIGANYFATDFSTFEATFNYCLMDAAEFQLYDYMTQFVPGGPEFSSLYREILGGTNRVVSKFFTLYVEAIRMSGEMSTSLGNGFTNLMLMLFLFSKAGCTDVDAKVEGDDGIGTYKGTPPTPEMYAMMGANIKLEIHESLTTASFCGIVFHPDDLINLVDIREVLVSFGWTTGKYSGSRPKILKMLLRAKALSLAYQYPGCPVLQSLSRYALRVTRDVRNYMTGFMNKQGSHAYSLWEREQILDAIKNLPSDEQRIPVVNAGIQTRLLAEKLYGIPVEMQKRIERYLDGLQSIQPLRIPEMDQFFHDHWKDYWNKYVADVYLVHINDPVHLVRSKARWDLT